MKNVFLLHFFIRFHTTAQQSILLLLLLSCHVDYVFVWPAKAPEDEAQAAVRVEADGDLSGRVKLTLQLDGAAEGTGGCVRHLNSSSNGHNTHNIWIYRQKCEVFHFHFLRGNKNLSAPPVWKWKWLINQKNVHSASSARRSACSDLVDRPTCCSLCVLAPAPLVVAPTDPFIKSGD